MWKPAVDWQDRQHFFAIAARVMRLILVDHARWRPDRRPLLDVKIDVAGRGYRRAGQVAEPLVLMRRD